ncbi:hypothetical protein HDU98_001864 [Podochytrium sp. JEL0797]|nr:hypothetical protein HDU98_001864 [Podochytrium sp. JEL0797]
MPHTEGLSPPSATNDTTSTFLQASSTARSPSPALPTTPLHDPHPTTEPDISNPSPKFSSVEVIPSGHAIASSCLVGDAFSEAESRGMQPQDDSCLIYNVSHIPSSFSTPCAAPLLDLMDPITASASVQSARGADKHNNTTIRTETRFAANPITTNPSHNGTPDFSIPIPRESIPSASSDPTTLSLHMASHEPLSPSQSLPLLSCTTSTPPTTHHPRTRTTSSHLPLAHRLHALRAARDAIEPPQYDHHLTRVTSTPPDVIATLPPSYWSGERRGDYADSDETECDSEGEVAGMCREVDLVVSQQRIVQAGGGAGRRKSVLWRRWRKRTRWMRKLVNVNWCVQFCLNWDVFFNALLLVSTLLLLVPSFQMSLQPQQTPYPNPNSTNYIYFDPTTGTITEIQGPSGVSNTSTTNTPPRNEITIYLPLLIPVVFTALSLAAKKAYKAVPPTLNPQYEPRSGPFTFFPKLYNLLYLVRCAMDVWAVGKYAQTTPYWTVGAVRAGLAVCVGGVGMFFGQLFPCEAGDAGDGNVSWEDKGGKRDSWSASGDGGIGGFGNACVSGDAVFVVFVGMVVVRVCVCGLMMWYTERLGRVVMRRLERNMGQRAREGMH